MRYIKSWHSIIDVAPPKVGHERPEFVRAEIGLDVRRLADSVRREWESLKQDDVIFLLAVEPLEGAHRLTNGHSTQAGQARSGLKFLRTAEIVQVQDGNGRPIRENIDRDGQGYRRPQRLRLLVNLDATAYKSDNERKSKGTIDVYESINVIVRRKGRENNFKRVLETIQSLALADIPVPGWLQDVFLGYGDPNGATYSRLENRLKSLDLRDTFLNWQHIVESLPGKVCDALVEIVSQSQGS